MRVAAFDRYGPPEVMRVEEAPKPVPRADEVVVRVHAAPVNTSDARLRGSRFPRGFTPFGRLAFGVFRPRRRVLGSAYSGIVDEVGANVTGVRPGDPVCGMTGARLGAAAEFVAVPADNVVAKPDDISHDDAAGVLFGGTTALTYLRGKTTVTPGASVLVIGASGAVGTNAVQLVKHFGAVVTGVTSGGNADLVTSLGATEVIDYRSTDLGAVTDRYDIVFDTVGSLSIASGRRLLTDGGVLLLGSADLAQTIRSRGNVKSGVASERPEDIAYLLGLVESGDLVVVIDAVYDLDDVAKAHARVDSGHKVGNVVLRL